MPELTPQQRKQLDSNIRNMLSQGASEDDVKRYAQDFRAKFDTPVQQPVQVAAEPEPVKKKGILSVIGSKAGSFKAQSKEKQDSSDIGIITPDDFTDTRPSSIDGAIRGGLSSTIKRVSKPEEVRIMEALSTVRTEPATGLTAQEGIDVFENDPVRTMWTPVQNKIFQSRNAPVIESIQQLPQQKRGISEQNSELLTRRKQIENLRFSSEAEAANFILSIADPSKLKLKGGVNMTRQPQFSDYDWNSVLDALPEGNMTAAAAIKQLNQTRNARAAFATSSTIEDAAIKYAMMQNGLQGDQVRKLEGYVPESMKANLVLNMLDDPDAAEVIASSPDLMRKANDEILRFPDKFPQAGVRILAEAISNAREARGDNKAVLNFTSAKVSDEIVSELVASGKLPKRFEEFYKRPDVRVAVNLSLKTPGFVENFGQSLGDTFLGMGKSVAELTGIRNLYKSGDDKLFSELDKQYSSVVFKPKSLSHKIGMFSGEITGQVLPLAATGGLIRATGLVKGDAAANMIGMGLQTFGNNLDRARVELPSAHWTTQLGYGLSNTGIEIALANVMNDTRLARNLVRSQAPAIRTVITKFTNKEISAAAAKSAINDIYTRLAQFGKGMTKVVVPETVEESATETLQIANNQVFGGEPISASEIGKRVFEVAETTLLGSGVIGLAGGAAQVRNTPSTAGMLLQMAEAPEKYADIIRGESVINPEYGADVDEKLDNLAFIAETKRQLDQRGMSEVKQGRFLLAALKKRILTKQQAQQPGPEVEQAIKEADAEQRVALSERETPVQIVKEFFEEGLLNEIEATGLQKSPDDPAFDEQKAMTYLKTIAQQANGFDPSWKPYDKRPTMPGVPQAIIDLANETFSTEIDAAYQNQINESGITIPKDQPVVETIDKKEVARQMQPVTDQMAEIERQFEAQGYKIDNDYDNQIIVTDKNGEIVAPEDVPADLVELAGQYEQATQKLSEFDDSALNLSLEDSRKKIKGEEVQAEIVEPKEIEDVPQSAATKLAAFKKKREQAATPPEPAKPKPTKVAATKNQPKQPAITEEQIVKDKSWKDSGTSFDGNTFKIDGKPYSVQVKERDKKDYIKVEVKDEEGEIKSEAVFYKDKDGKYYANDLMSYERGKGFARAMYDFISKKYGIIRPSNTQKGEGKKFWEKNQSPAPPNQPKQQAITEEQTDIEAKKDGIEKRRQRELDAVSVPPITETQTGSRDLTPEEEIEVTRKLLTVGNKIKVNGKNATVKKMPNGSIAVLDENGGLVSGIIFLPAQINEALPNFTYLIYQNGLDKIEDKRTTTRENTAEIKRQKDAINKKYDAELAALRKEQSVESKSSLPESQPNVRTEVTRQLINEVAEVMGAEKYTGDFTDNYIQKLQDMGNLGYEVSQLLNSPKRAMEVIEKFKAGNISPAPQNQPKQQTQPMAAEKKVQRKIRDEKIRKNIDDAWDDFMKGGGLLTSGGLDPEKIEKGTKLIGLYIKSGVYKFSDILEDAYAKFGENLRNFIDALKSVYSTYYNTRATDEEAAQMDATTRGINLDDVIANFKTQSDDGGTTSIDDRTGIQEPSGMAEGSAPGTLQGVDEGRAGGMGSQESGTEPGSERGSDQERDGRGSGPGDNAEQLDVPLNGNDKINEDLG